MRAPAITVAAALLLTGPFAQGQLTMGSRPLSDEPARYPKLSVAIVSGVYGALYTYTYLAWYRHGERSRNLHFRQEGWFGKDTYAGGADKLGHAWTNYALTRGMSGIMQWGGYSRRASLVASTTLALSFSIIIEVKDGYEPEYGFSWADVGLNLGGNALGLAMVLSPKLDEMFDFRIEYWPSKYFRKEVATAGPFNSAEDYSGQRFLISYHLSSFDPLRDSPLFVWTSWLDLTLGYQARHYKPDAIDPNDPVQSLFVGISVNLQHLLERTLMPRSAAGKHGAGLQALHFATEIVAMPFTTLKVAGVSRKGTQTTAER